MQSRRIDLEREISIRVPAFDSFVTEYSSNVSTTGMFIRSDKPLPPDTQISFEFKVADDWKLIRGKATVVWTRYRSEGAERPAGMGVLYTELDSQSRRLINWIIEKHVRDGGVAFDLDALKNDYDESLAALTMAETTASIPPAATRSVDQLPIKEPLRPTRPSPPKRPVRQEPLRMRLGPLLLAGIAGTILLSALFWLSEQGVKSIANPDLSHIEASSESAPDTESRPAETPTAAVSVSPETAQSAPADNPPAANEPRSVAATASPSPPAGAEPSSVTSTEPPQTVAAGVRRLIAGWSQGWQNQNVEAYLSHYARRFAPSNGQSRSDWAATRAQRLRAPDFIEITVSELEIEWIENARARATFSQGYRSNSYQDEVQKVLELVREDGGWKILEEKSAG